MTEARTQKAPQRRRRRGRGRPKGQSKSASAPLFKRSSSHFEPGDRQRGNVLFREGAVDLEVDGSRARASVQGNEQESYRVGVDWKLVPERRRLHVFCQCQRFQGGKYCKHIWATLLALSEAGAQHEPSGKDRVGMRKDRAAAWRDLGLPDESSDNRNSNGRARGRRRSNARRRGPGATVTWQSQLDQLTHEINDSAEQLRARPAISERGVRFFVNAKASQLAGTLVLDVLAPKPPARRPRRGGNQRRSATPKLQKTAIEPAELEQILKLASGNGGSATALVTGLPIENRPAKTRQKRKAPAPAPEAGIQRFAVPPKLYRSVLPSLCQHQMVGWWDGRKRNAKEWLSWDADPPWELVLRLEMTAGNVRLRGELERNGLILPLTAPLLILPSRGPGAGAAKGDPGHRLLVMAETIGLLESTGPSDLHWIEFLLDVGELVIPREELSDALGSLLEMPGVPRVDAPEELQLSEERSPMQPRLTLEPDPTAIGPDPTLLAELSFLYGDSEVSSADSQASIIDWDERCFVRRDLEGEHQALLRLLETEVRPLPSGKGYDLELEPAALPPVAEALLTDGWSVEVRGRALRAPSPPALRVESGIDWFELSGSADFDGDELDFKSVLAAIRRGDRFVELKDGSSGILPSAWVETYDSLAELADGDGEDGLRFRSSQALLVDTLLTAMPPADVDAEFAALRDKLRSFESIKPKKESRGFRGELREYQRDGLGWLEFLREFGLGGILADDMGLGKTVQVLAMVQANRTAKKSSGRPYLVVAPRSLMYNWVEEAGRFTPKLKVVEYRGRGREALRDKLLKKDIVVTTYGTLRRDIDYLATLDFDTVILDEAQAIKNRDSQAAKASRVLRADHRLALTGTPIENHLSELGSILEFLNPGMLGRSPRLELLNGSRAPSKRELAMIAEGIRPFILRRTKAQVLKDLPPKTEQVLYCDLFTEQRELYDKLRATYQASLLDGEGGEAISGNTMQVLEALLRLRQVACHPGLVNDEWEEAGSAKLELVFDQLTEVIEEGHKAIVFSQFTKLLAYVRKQLDEQRDSVRLPRRQDARPRRGGRALPDRSGHQRLPDQPQGRRRRPQPDRCRIRLPARPVVEPGGRGAGDRPRASHRPDPARLRLPPDRTGHGRGEDHGAAAQQARDGRDDPRGRGPDRRRPHRRRSSRSAQLICASYPPTFPPAGSTARRMACPPPRRARRGAVDPAGPGDALGSG